MQIHLNCGLILSLIIILSTCSEYTNALRCFICDSTQDKNCAIQPDDPEIKHDNCKSALSLCAMSIVGETTYRGCSLEINEGKYYRECNKILCNYEIWPPGRQKCFQCSGKDCIEEQTGKGKPCLRFLEEDGCFTDVINKTYAVRGCLSDKLTLSPNAVKCPYNNCNYENGIQTITCIDCNDEKTGCKRINPPSDPTKQCYLDENFYNLKNCTVEYLFGAANETCFIYHRLNNVIRGCSAGRPDLAKDKEHFHACEGDKCNNKCLNVTKCIVCNSLDNANCQNNPKEFKLQSCAFEQSTCYAKITDENSRNGGYIERGCGTPADIENKGYQCQGDGCNVKDIQKCYKCSSKDDPNCSKWSNPNAVLNEICTEPDDDCLIVITDDHHTVRGCKSSQLNCNSKSIACKNCTGSFCNNGIYPEYRLNCYQCLDTEICDRDQITNNIPFVCTKFHLEDECIEFINRKNGNMIRGCKSDSDLMELCNKENEKCVKCTEDGCNHHKIFEKPKLSCYKCDDTKESKGSCAWTQKNSTLIKCKQDVMFYDNETCFTLTDNRGQVKRGCSLDINLKMLDLNLNNNSNYKKCDSLGCNHIKVKNQTCVQCRSDDTNGENCKNNVAKIKPTTCEEKYQYFEKIGCFIQVNSKNIVSRGCSFKLTDDELKNCYNSNGTHCMLCQGNNCNLINAIDIFGSSSKPILTKWSFLLIVFGILILN